MERNSGELNIVVFESHTEGERRGDLVLSKTVKRKDALSRWREGESRVEECGTPDHPTLCDRTYFGDPLDGGGHTTPYRTGRQG